MRTARKCIAFIAAAPMVAGCGHIYGKDDWVIIGFEDADIERIDYVADSLKDCAFRLGQFSWSRYVAYSCATGCEPPANNRIRCETKIARRDLIQPLPPQP